MSLLAMDEALPAAEAADTMNFPIRADSKLCKYCQALIDKLPSLEKKAEKVYFDETSHYSKLTLLSRSAAEGCGLCTRLIEESSKQARKCDDKSRRYVGLDLEEDILEMVSIIWQYDTWSYCLYYARTYFAVSILEVSKPGLNYDDLEGRPSTKDGLPILRHWLDNCRRHHACHQGLTSKYMGKLPSRLIKVSDDRLHLCLSSELDTEVEYATLSHCWGTLQFQKLETRNYDQFLCQIPEDALTKTFKHAVFTARCLAIDYLWIDSLCIVQDSEHDWRHESSRMDMVYHNALLNLAATSAKDGTEGFFFERRPTWRCQVRTRSLGKDYHYECVSWHHFETMLDAPLLKRGWVFQERNLSRRAANFTDRELYWMCKETTIRESFPPGHLRTIPHIHRSTELLPNTNVWVDLVQHYSACLLTVTQDKLVAISGIAGLFYSYHKHIYLAGLWAEELAPQLCWQTNDLNKCIKRLTPYIAPSWSWASIDRQVHYEHRSLSRPSMLPLRHLVSFHNAKIKPTDPLYVLGALDYGHIRLKCTALLHCYIPAGRQDGYAKYKVRISDFESVARETVIRFDTVEDGLNYDPDTFCVPAISYKKKYPHEKYGSDLECLLLRPTGVKRGQYRRIGLLTISKEPGPDGMNTKHEVILSPEGGVKPEDCLEDIRDDEGELLQNIIELV